jgi:hypothetical protein
MKVIGGECKQNWLPHIGTDEHGCATMEWWNGTRKLTLYTVGHPLESLLMSWGANVQQDMVFVSLMDGKAVLEAFKWLAEGESNDGH